jgi:hypothetical protein
MIIKATIRFTIKMEREAVVNGAAELLVENKR